MNILAFRNSLNLFYKRLFLSKKNQMDVNTNTQFIDLKNVIDISRGDHQKLHKYLNQFVSLIPNRVDKLKFNLKKGDKPGVRKVLHNMAPQIQFFGVSEIETEITRVELELDKLTMEELNNIVDRIVDKLEKAISEVNSILAQ